MRPASVAIDYSVYALLMEVHVRQAKPVDPEQLARLREALWPETSAEEHARQLQPILAGEPPGSMRLVNFVAETADGRLLGFAEVDLRSHADGCSPALPVGYLEGWYVAEGARHTVSAAACSVQQKIGRGATDVPRWPPIHGLTTSSR